jgi:hypothetical protein
LLENGPSAGCITEGGGEGERIKSWKGRRRIGPVLLQIMSEKYSRQKKGREVKENETQGEMKGTVA